MKNEDEYADKLVRQMREEGLTFGDMLKVVRAIDRKFKKLIRLTKTGY